MNSQQVTSLEFASVPFGTSAIGVLPIKSPTSVTGSVVPLVTGVVDAFQVMAIPDIAIFCRETADVNDEYK